MYNETLRPCPRCRKRRIDILGKCHFCKHQTVNEMENQHGYRELSQEEIDTMNNIKEMGEAVGDFIEAMPDSIDERWLAIAKTNLQQGFMALTRAVAQPDFF